MSTALYVVLLIVRSIIAMAILFKYGWKAFGLAMTLALLCAVTELPEGIA